MLIFLLFLNQFLGGGGKGELLEGKANSQPNTCIKTQK